MGFIYANISISNPRKPDMRPIEAPALADSGALHLCLPEHIALQLELDELYKREVTIADGRKQICPYVGPVEIRFENRACYTGALVIGDEILLGSVPIEDLDVILSPSQRTVIVNPESPNIAMSKVK